MTPAAPSPHAGPGAASPPVPRYGQASLADLVPSLLSAVGAPGFANPLQLEPLRAVCLLLVDGLGFELLLGGAEIAPFLATTAARSPLTAGFPSTTATSLASIGTGRPPGEHGLVGYTIWLPGEKGPLNTLRWAPYGVGEQTGDAMARLVPEQVQPDATAFERAAAHGVDVVLVGPALHAHSGMTRAVLRGGRYRPADTLDDTVTAALAALAEPGPRLVYAYHPDLDLIGHVHGVASDQWRAQLTAVDAAAARLAEGVPAGCGLVVTGDHGMIDVPPEARIDVDDVPELRAGVAALAGEPRARHVHAIEGAAGEVLAAWRERLGDTMWIVSRAQAIDEGWFGPFVADRVRQRIGDVVAAARGSVAVVQRSVDPAQATLIGHHGSLTSAEELVPFVLVTR